MRGKGQILVIVKILQWYHPTYAYNNTSSQPPLQVGLAQARPNYPHLFTTSFFAADKPTSQQLIKVNKRDGTKISIIDQFVAHSMYKLVNFAIMLLGDTVKVNTLRKQNKDEESFINEVLYYWLDLDDDSPGYPRTWKALAKCVSDAGLTGTFARAIREIYYPDPPAGVCVCVCVCVVCACMHACMCVCACVCM